MAVPISVGVALFLVETSPRKLASPILFLVQLLAAIPSVVFGMWGIFVLAPFLRIHIYPALQSALGWIPLFQGNQNGLGILTASIILAVMIVPIITAVSTDVLRAVPGTQREASLALGATKWEAALIVLDNANPGSLAPSSLVSVGQWGDDGGHDADRESCTDCDLAVWARLHDRISYPTSSAEATSEIYLQSLIELGLVCLW